MTTFELLEIGGQIIKITGFAFLYLEILRIRKYIEKAVKDDYNPVFTPRGNNNLVVTGHQSNTVVKRGLKNEK